MPTPHHRKNAALPTCCISRHVKLFLKTRRLIAYGIQDRMGWAYQSKTGVVYVVGVATTFHGCNNNMFCSMQKKVKTRGQYNSFFDQKNMVLTEEVRGKSRLCLIVTQRLLLSSEHQRLDVYGLIGFKAFGILYLVGSLMRVARSWGSWPPSAFQPHDWRSRSDEPRKRRTPEKKHPREWMNVLAFLVKKGHSNSSRLSK